MAPWYRAYENGEMDFHPKGRVDQLVGPWGWDGHPTFDDGNPYIMCI